MATRLDDSAFPWSLGIFDAHCHPTDTLTSLQSIPSMRAKVLTIMATRAQDQELVAQAADSLGLTEMEVAQGDQDWSNLHKIIPAFGWHPWFSHQMFDEVDFDGVTSLSAEQKASHYQAVLNPKSEDRNFLLSLPDPMPFREFLGRMKTHLEKYSLALVGEVGLDRSFRIPEAWLPEQNENRDDTLTPGGREARRLSPYRVSMDHQKKVLLAQLALAGEMQRAVSVHGVQAHGVVYDAIAQTWKGHERRKASKRDKKRDIILANDDTEQYREEDQNASSDPKPYPPRICLHSFSGPAETVRQYVAPSVPCDIFFSFSTTINAWSGDGDGKVEAAVRAVPDNRILIESDLHTAGDRMDAYLEEITRKICTVKRWELESGVKQLGRNWKHFALGRCQTQDFELNPVTKDI